MRQSQNAVLAALRRAHDFLLENAALLAVLLDLTGALRRLAKVLESFTAHAYDQDFGDRGAKGETAKQRQLRVSLRRHQMEPIAVIARGNLRKVPEFAALQMPKQWVRGQALIASANAMIDAAAKHHDMLIEQGLSSNFIDEFKEAVEKLASSMGERERSRTRRTSATKGLDVEEKNARMILNVLDAHLERVLVDNEPLLRGWQGARLIRRQPGGPAAPAATPTQTGTEISLVTPTAEVESTPATAA
ncbi:MAG: hypothetical protein ACJ796_09465 [Gemmatimonadaceae bacterium]